MHLLRQLGTLALLSASACSGTDGPANRAKPPSGKPAATVSESTAFDPGPVEDGYTRFTAKTIKGVEPGGNVTYCQYVMAPTDHDVDVLDVTGAQSEIGHHAIAFAYTDNGTQEVGAILPCMGTEYTKGDAGASNASLSIGGFLGAAGGKGRAAVKLPDGVAFRLRKGDGIMMNVHYLNTTDRFVDGDSVVDVKFADVDPQRPIAAMFVNVNFDVSLAPNAPTSSSVQCVAQSDMRLLMANNHMHDYGSSTTTEVVRADTGASDMLHADPTWTSDMQFNPVFSTWTIDDPFVVHSGDTIKTTCNWTNRSTETVTFPREMCVGVGFVLANGENPHAPGCLGGNWLPQYF
jgi:hypothetical protein